MLQRMRESVHTGNDLNEVLDSLVHEVDADLALGLRAAKLVLEELGKSRLGQTARS